MPTTMVRLLVLAAATATVACASAAGSHPAAGSGVAADASRAPTPRYSTDSATPASVRALLSVLADDSMEGRGTATDGGDRAAKFIAEQMKRIGLEPGGDSGYFQRVPLVLRNKRAYALKSFAEFDSLPPAQRRIAVNVVGIVRGARTGSAQTPSPADSVVLIDAHYDHLGIGRAVNGDSIYNGADDDGSGTVAVLEVARAIRRDGPHRRTIIFVATTGEEIGLLGTNWYVAHPWAPIKMMVANLEFEMIGRPDSLAGGAGRAWLTGYERSTMGATFHAAGLAVMPDARPCQHFFTRSDNKAFADAGVPAHTLSTFNLHTDYHRPSDELSKVDFDHMAKVINIGIHAIRMLADGPAPVWLPGGRPKMPDTKPDTVCPRTGRGGG